jgi:hypothetical protein
MSYFYLQTHNCKIKDAAKEAERYISALIEGEIKLPDFFTHTSDTPLEVIQNFKSGSSIPVREYTSSWFYRNVLGYFDGRAIYVNTRFSKNADIASIAGNLVHEYCHSLGYKHKGDKVTTYNLQSVPYVLGYSCRDFLSQN